MAFEFKKCEIEGLYEIQPKIFGDNRGYFLETYSEKDFFKAGLTMKFVQDNQSRSTKNVLRGLHFQTKHPQGKLVRALEGKVYDVAVDLRLGSATFGKYYGVILDSEKQNMFYIPKGFAHGFCVLTDSATTHAITPPIAPSTVFLGLMCGTNLCLPKNTPAKYAPLSVIHAITNVHKTPSAPKDSNSLIKWHINTVINTVTKPCERTSPAFNLPCFNTIAII